MERLLPTCEECGTKIGSLWRFLPRHKLARDEISCPECQATLLVSGKAWALSFLAGSATLALGFLLLRWYLVHAGPIREAGPAIVALLPPIVGYQLVAAWVCRRYAVLTLAQRAGS